MTDHLATLRNKSIGSWFARIRDYPNAKWVWLGVHSRYEAITLPAQVYVDVGKRRVANVSYRIPEYMKTMLDNIDEFDPKFTNTVNLVMLLKVDLIKLGKGTYPKVRPYVVRISDDALRILEKRCWELTGEDSLDKKVWEFDMDSHPLFTDKSGEIKSHAKYPLREGLTFVEKFEASFDHTCFDWTSRQQASLQEGLRYIITDPTDTRIARWCFGRVKFANILKRRMIA